MTGLSRPQRSRVGAIASGVTFGLRPRIRSGDPGIIRNSTKLRMTSRTIVKIAWTTCSGQVPATQSTDLGR